MEKELPAGSGAAIKMYCKLGPIRKEEPLEEEADDAMALGQPAGAR